MALFNNWFSRKAEEKAVASGAAVSVQRAPTAVAPENPAAKRRTLRLQQRELLYNVIRESMVHAGVLSSSYKFKVLSLDSQGRQYLVMMDLARDIEGNTKRLADIEIQMAHSAMTRHDILVTAVYWRANEHLLANVARTSSANMAPAGSLLHPIHLEEEGGVPIDPLAELDATVEADRRYAMSATDFEDTVIEEPAEPELPRKGTQYGDLN